MYAGTEHCSQLIVVLLRTHAHTEVIEKPHKKWKRNLGIFSCKYWAIFSLQTGSCVYSGSLSRPVCLPRIAPTQVIHNCVAPLCYRGRAALCRSSLLQGNRLLLAFFSIRRQPPALKKKKKKGLSSVCPGVSAPAATMLTQPSWSKLKAHEASGPEGSGRC